MKLTKHKFYELLNFNSKSLNEGKIAFNKNENATKIDSTKASKSVSTNSKIKKKLISMRRCSTVQTLLPVEYAANKNNDGCDILAENFKSIVFLS